MRVERMPAGGPGEPPYRPPLLLPGRAAQPRVPKQNLPARLRRANAPVSSKRGLYRTHTIAPALSPEKPVWQVRGGIFNMKDAAMRGRYRRRRGMEEERSHQEAPANRNDAIAGGAGAT